ncbi:MAG: glutathione S-transferase family protein [Polyangiaceae bacterium]|nr:glutathione S-transferase family protein [Polyangiaceae bacterium]NUQ73293.1 glutathione S-transferase family protein [Polyangiaceae bacterium]
MKLYFAPNTRAVRPRWLLEELEVPYVLERLDLSKGEHKSLDYMKIHPHGAVPSLVDGSLAMFESAAIVMYLADKYPEKGLAPAPGTPDRGLYYQWILYSMTTLEPPLLQYFLHTRMYSEEKRSAAAAEEARGRIEEIWKILAHELRDRTYIVGNHFTAADVMLGSMIGWAKPMGLLDKAGPEITEYLGRLAERPAHKRAFAKD